MASTIDFDILPETELKKILEQAGMALKKKQPSPTSKSDLTFYLDKKIREHGLTDLHTHLMGMGSADFWVNRIMETFLVNLSSSKSSTEVEVWYDIDKLMTASSFEYDEGSVEDTLTLSLFEARFFDGFEKHTLGNSFQKREGKYAISNSTLTELLREESSRYHNSQEIGPLRCLVRNWFEFLGSNGQPAHPSDVLQTYRGNFTPTFNQRFAVKDFIVNKHPEVLEILLNTTLNRYSKAGVWYVEYSVSCGDILDKKKYKAIYVKRNKEKLPTKRKISNVTEGDAGEEEFEDLNNQTTSSSSSFSMLMAPSFSPKKSKVATIATDAETVLTPNDLISSSSPSSLSAAHPKMAQTKATFILPEPIQSFTPAWSKYINNYPKARGQTYTLLAAFVRSKAKHFRIDEKGVFAPDVKKSTPREKYFDFGLMANNVAHIKSFLGNSLEQEPSSIIINLPQWNDDNVTFEGLCNSDSSDICHYLECLAKVLNQDSELFRIFANESFAQRIKLLKDLIEKEDESGVKPHVVGLDWVGDELGHPFCVFARSDFVETIVDLMQFNPYFGVRIHAGEGPIRPSTLDSPTSTVRLAFYLHMYIVVEGIKCVYDRVQAEINERVKKGNSFYQGLTPNIRIGHGVAFLFGYDCSEEENNHPFCRYLADFREQYLIQHDIVCELNPTSNHMLLPATFGSTAKNQNTRTLRAFLDSKLPVVLGTDDDGIWSIHKCKAHYHHISVAAEYCEGIEKGDIRATEEIDKMLSWGRKAAFASCKENQKQVED